MCWKNVMFRPSTLIPTSLALPHCITHFVKGYRISKYPFRKRRDTLYLVLIPNGLQVAFVNMSSCKHDETNSSYLQIAYRKHLKTKWNCVPWCFFLKVRLCYLSFLIIFITNLRLDLKDPLKCMFGSVKEKSTYSRNWIRSVEFSSCVPYSEADCFVSLPTHQLYFVTYITQSYWHV